jgi:hypothetical protein
MTRIKRIDNVLTGQGVEREPKLADFWAAASRRPGRSFVYKGVSTPLPEIKWRPLSQGFTYKAADGTSRSRPSGKFSNDTSIYRCTVCGAEDFGDRPDCPRDGVHCNIVEKD